MSTNLLSLIDQFFDEGIRPIAYTLGRPITNSPALNIKEREDHYEVSLAVPGIDPQKVKVEIKENILTISFEDKKEEINKDGDMIRQEYHEYVSFSRSLSLPKTVDSNSIKAKYNRGILTINITKIPEAQPKTINVEVEE